MAKPYFMIHSAVTKMPNSYTIGVDPKTGQPHTVTDGKEEELCQFACEFKAWPMSENYFRKAFDEMRERCLEKARSAGLVKA